MINARHGSTCRQSEKAGVKCLSRKAVKEYKPVHLLKCSSAYNYDEVLVFLLRHIVKATAVHFLVS